MNSCKQSAIEPKCVISKDAVSPVGLKPMPMVKLPCSSGGGGGAIMIGHGQAIGVGGIIPIPPGGTGHIGPGIPQGMTPQPGIGVGADAGPSQVAPHRKS